MTKQIISAIKIIVLALVLSFGFSYVYAWTAPTSQPPAGNVSAPINTGDNTQYKAGNLVLNDSVNPFTNGLIVRYGNMGIGTTAPGAKLEIKAGTDGTQVAPVTALKIWGPNTPMGSNSAQDLQWGFSSAGSAKIRAYRGGSWDTNLQFLTNTYGQGSDNPQVRMHISENGNVGVGTTAPAQKLEVAGNIKASGTICDGSNNCVGAGGGVTSVNGQTGAVIAGSACSITAGGTNVPANGGVVMYHVGTGQRSCCGYNTQYNANQYTVQCYNF